MLVTARTCLAVEGAEIGVDFVLPRAVEPKTLDACLRRHDENIPDSSVRRRASSVFRGSKDTGLQDSSLYSALRASLWLLNLLLADFTQPRNAAMTAVDVGQHEEHRGRIICYQGVAQQ